MTFYLKNKGIINELKVVFAVLFLPLQMLIGYSEDIGILFHRDVDPFISLGMITF